MPVLTLPDFATKWTASTRSERAASQEHFIDLCRLLGQLTPNEADPSGDLYAFEKGTTKTLGGDGFADVWRRGHFAWEYKGKHKDLAAAYRQLLQYREDLENPPLLVVCDMDRFEVHTNFTDTIKHIYAFTLADLASPVPIPSSTIPPLEVLRRLFTEPGRLRPQRTPAQVTEQAASEFAHLADSLRDHGADPEQAAHFLMRLLFCLFSEDIGLLPRGLFKQLVEHTRTRPLDFVARVRQLFGAMASGGSFGVEDIAYFDGGLFADDQVLDLTTEDLAVLSRASQLDWSNVEPAIFGTLFERSLDPSKRSQLGAHYTSRDDILLIVEPVLMVPLRRRWAEVQERAAVLITRRNAAAGAARTRHQQALARLLTVFAGEIAAVRVLDPACGSGNFLYVALKRLLDLEKAVITFAASNGLTGFFPQVGPEQLHGMEMDPYAHELAQVVVWIGYIQWLHDNGFGSPSSPILKPLHTIQRMDAVLARDEAGKAVEPTWPVVDVIVGNPPFLGDKNMRGELGDAYVEELRRHYAGRVPGAADFVTYWFERARAQIAHGSAKRAGLLATQGIRGSTNRRVLERIKESGDIFMAWRDRPWLLEGAAVHVSVIGFDSGAEESRTLDGVAVLQIHADLTATLDLTVARRLQENLRIAFQGPVVVGPFNIPPDVADGMLRAPNPNAHPSADVIVPVVNAADLTGRSRGWWIIDFGERTEAEAALYEAPFEYVRTHVKPLRDTNRREKRRTHWWQHGETAPGIREALAKKARQIATPRVSKHRIFVWLPAQTRVTDAVVAITRESDYFLGVLHSRPHELWALRMGTQLREVESGFRYTPTTTFETFPFPWPPGSEPLDDPRVKAVAEGARDLVEKRDRWLKPPSAAEAELRQRTLTNLYNQRPTWLDMAHRTLDQVVLDAYGWPHDLTDEQILERLLTLNLARAST